MTLADLPILQALLDACDKGNLLVRGMSYSIRQGDSEITVSIETIPLSEDDDEPRGRTH